jgi:hypothetical protein
LPIAGRLLLGRVAEFGIAMIAPSRKGRKLNDSARKISDGECLMANAEP